MASFWGLFLLAAYGIFGGFVYTANDILGGMGVSTDPWFTQVPLLGDFSVGTAVALGLQLIVAFLLYRWLSRPKVADYLIETEAEMNKVTWPSWRETRTGTFAVVVTVVVMLFFLMAVDYVFLEAFKRLFSINLGG